MTPEQAIEFIENHPHIAFSKDVAYKLMQRGNKITHLHFTSNEYLYIGEDGLMYAEDGVLFDEEWQRRTDEVWQSSWKIWK